jgi:hypothetical protein
MNTALRLSLALLLSSCAVPGSTNELDLVLHHYASGVSVGMRAIEFVALPGATPDENGAVRIALGDSARGFSVLSARVGSASEPVDSNAVPRWVELQATGDNSGPVADSARGAVTRLLGVAATEACSGRNEAPLRVSWWRTGDGIVFVQSSEGASVATLGPRSRLVFVPGATEISGAVGTETSPGRCHQQIAAAES